MLPKLTAMEQHALAKRQYPDAIVLFRLGDFYEMFGEDAIVCSKVLELTLTSRNKGKIDELPMAGVPHHAVSGYIGRLLKSGYKVAICEQMADPSTVKGVVPREVVRVLTPGTVTQGEHLDAERNNWLAALQYEGVWALALLELSTGELEVCELRDAAAAWGELARASPAELVLGEGTLEHQAALQSALASTVLRADSPLSPSEQTLALGDLEAGHLSPLERAVSARVLRFARACAPGLPMPVRRIVRYDPSANLIIDATAQRHLELVESNTGDKRATVLGVLNCTRTVLGARLLRKRLLAPSAEVATVRRRLDWVEAFVSNAPVRTKLREVLGDVSDVERLSVRVQLGEASPRDLGALRSSLLAARRIVDLLQAALNSGLGDMFDMRQAVDTHDALAQRLDRALVDRPPALLKDGAVFRADFDPLLCELSNLKQAGEEHLSALETRLKSETGIANLRVKHTRVFGWYVEVSRAQSGRVPEGWRRKQTVANAERYTLAELDDLADRLAHADERFRERELELFAELVAQVRSEVEGIRQLGERLAEWDLVSSLGELAHRCDYVRPEVEESLDLQIVEGRHPVVERLAADGRFVPNDVGLASDGRRFWIITGPNMAGKSTFLRQVAVIVVMAQLGSFVPAKSARIGLVDRVLSRVGASDNLAGGESTFMVEMRETSEILQKATRRSLVILDEIGRGTSTFDGLAIAWAVAEYLDEVVCCRALFATHYHELTELAEQSPSIANYSVSARQHGSELVFVHRVLAGATNKSYGVAVAKLAGLPASVVARAEALLATLESPGEAPVSRSGTAPSKRKRQASSQQLVLFGGQPPASQSEAIALTLRALDLDRLTPLEALQLLTQLKKRV